MLWINVLFILSLSLISISQWRSRCLKDRLSYLFSFLTIQFMLVCQHLSHISPFASPLIWPSQLPSFILHSHMAFDFVRWILSFRKFLMYYAACSHSNSLYSNLQPMEEFPFFSWIELGISRMFKWAFNYWN